MELYRLVVEDDPTQFFARKPQHIIDVVSHYHKHAVDKGIIDHPELSKWARHIPSLSDIVKVDKGLILYHVGMINFNPDDVDMKGAFYSERMQVTDDFEVCVSREAILYFDQQRMQLPHLKREELYKFQIQGVLGTLNFIPEDVVRGIVDYDLTPHYEASEKVRGRIDKAKSEHPNLA